MNKPMIENSDRGITINKSLAWTMVVGLLGAGLWLGTQMAEVRTSLDVLNERQSEDRVSIQQNLQRINDLRRSEARVDQRLISIERSVTNTEVSIQEVLRFVRNGQEGPRP